MKKAFVMCLVLWGFSLNTVIAQSIDQFRIMPDRTEGIAGIRLSNFNGSGSVTIPFEVNGFPVRVLGADLFRGKELFTITIPNSIVTIENDAFRENFLTSLIIPNSVTFIGESAFRNNLLTSVTIPNSVTTIRNWAFQDNLITSITIGENVRIEDNSFPENFRRAYNNTAGTYTRPNVNSTQSTRR